MKRLAVTATRTRVTSTLRILEFTNTTFYQLLTRQGCLRERFSRTSVCHPENKWGGWALLPFRKYSPAASLPDVQVVAFCWDSGEKWVRFVFSPPAPKPRRKSGIKRRFHASKGVEEVRQSPPLGVCRRFLQKSRERLIIPQSCWAILEFQGAADEEIRQIRCTHRGGDRYSRLAGNIRDEREPDLLQDHHRTRADGEQSLWGTGARRGRCGNRLHPTCGKPGGIRAGAGDYQTQGRLHRYRSSAGHVQGRRAGAGRWQNGQRRRVRGQPHPGQVCIQI